MSAVREVIPKIYETEGGRDSNKTHEMYSV